MVGGPEEIRTPDPQIGSLVLLQNWHIGDRAVPVVEQGLVATQTASRFERRPDEVGDRAKSFTYAIEYGGWCQSEANIRSNAYQDGAGSPCYPAAGYGNRRPPARFFTEGHWAVNGLRQ